MIVLANIFVMEVTREKSMDLGRVLNVQPSKSLEISVT